MQEVQAQWSAFPAILFQDFPCPSTVYTVHSDKKVKYRSCGWPQPTQETGLSQWAIRSRVNNYWSVNALAVTIRLSECGYDRSYNVFERFCERYRFTTINSIAIQITLAKTTIIAETWQNKTDYKDAGTALNHVSNAISTSKWCRARTAKQK